MIIKLAESLSPITKKLYESTKKITGVINPTNFENEINQEIVPVEVELEDSEDENIDNNYDMKALPNNLKFSDLVKNTIGKLMSSKNSLGIDQDRRTGGASINNTPILILGGESWKIGVNVQEITPEIHTALSPGYTGGNMKNENGILMMNNIIRDLGYTIFSDKKSNRKTFFTTKPPKLVEDIQNKTFDDLQGRGLKIIIPSNKIDIYSRLGTLLGLKLSGHTDTPTEASNLSDELYKRGEIQNKQQYRNALDKFST